MSAVGVKTQIWNNQVKSVLLLLGFPALLLGMIWLFFVLIGTFQPELSVDMLGTNVPLDAGWIGLTRYWHIAIFIASAWYLIAAFFYQSLLNGITGAKAVERKDQPKLYNLLENLCISRGLTMPRLYIIETDALNAYASGLTSSAMSITVTSGLLAVLSDQEVEAVLAHELTHILNNDTQLVLIGVIFAGMLTLICDLIWRSTRYMRFSGGSGKGKGNVAVIMLIALVVFLIGRVFALGLRFALSRDREFMADAGSVELTKNPDALISALHKIAKKPEIQGISGELAQMCIEDANDDTPDWFSTHPSMGQRIQALEMMGGKEAPGPAEIASGAWTKTKEGPWG